MSARYPILLALPTVALLALAGLVVTDPPRFAVAATPSGNPESRSGNADAGRKIVLEGTEAGAAPCSACHKENGAGDPEQKAPRIAGQHAPYLEKQLRDYASGSRQNEIMTPIAQALSDEEKANVAAYFAEAEAPFPEPAGRMKKAMRTLGETLATVGVQDKGVEGCANCHGPQGIGLPPSYPYLAGQQADYIKQQLTNWQQGGRDNDAGSVMRYVAQKLDGHDIDAVAQYFAAVRPTGDDAEARLESRSDTQTRSR